MSSLREGLHAPRRALAEDELERLRAYLDGQSRVRLAVWASHEHRTPDGPDFDSHLLLGISEADWTGGNAAALERGLWNELPHLGWLDLFSMDDAPIVRERFEVLWERPEAGAEDLDPLDFRLTYEPLEVRGQALAALPGLFRTMPDVRRIEACRERLWRNGREVEAETRFYLVFGRRRPSDFEQVERALRKAGVWPGATVGMAAGLPHDERVRTAVLYER